MTKNKRFTVNDRWIKDNCIGALLNIDFNTITDANLCCDLLNQIEKEKRNNGKLASKLLGENEQLKEDNMLLIEDSEKYRKLSIQFDNRNKELISENEQLKHDATVLIQANQDYRRENEQLKSVIKEVTELLSDEVDLFSEKATEHDIIAYVELTEFDNKDAFYMATATKKAIRMLKELQE